MLVDQAGAGEVQLVGDRCHVDDVVGGRVQIEPVPGQARSFLGPRPTAGAGQGFEHRHLAAGHGQVAGGHEAVVAGSDDYGFSHGCKAFRYGDG